jgi:UDP-glucose 4-epimerase
VFNICTGSATSVLKLAQTIASLCGQAPAIRFRAARQGEVTHSYGDSSAAKQALGLVSSTELKTGLAATLAWLEGVCDPQ